jgi:hypothetical protein
MARAEIVSHSGCGWFIAIAGWSVFEGYPPPGGAPPNLFIINYLATPTCFKFVITNGLQTNFFKRKGLALFLTCEDGQERRSCLISLFDLYTILPGSGELLRHAIVGVWRGVSVVWGLTEFGKAFFVPMRAHC